jgi:hypothetical protein
LRIPYGYFFGGRKLDFLRKYRKLAEKISEGPKKISKGPKKNKHSYSGASSFLNILFVRASLFPISELAPPISFVIFSENNEGYALLAIN